jgi:hypothetical protein
MTSSGSRNTQHSRSGRGERCISCTGIIRYDDAELAGFPQQALGRLSKKHLQELGAAIQAGGAMVEWEMQRVCDAIAAG